jgi:ABC-type multidrug transport system fused ATPase/permease subunit
VKTTNEALQGMQSLKMFSWEENFAASIGKNRNVELGFLKKVAYLRAFSRAYMSALPGLVAVTSFIVYALAYKGAEITAATLFAALVAFDQLRFPLLFYPVSLAQLAQAKVSAARVQKFLEMKEVGNESFAGGGSYSRMDEGAGEIRLQNATIYWSDPNIPLEETQHSRRSSRNNDDTETSENPPMRYPKPILSNVSLHIRPGELCAVVGRVGSGKSTLCSAILNETLLMSGEITLKGSVAYASQTPWILNATLRDNILFGLPLDEERYKQVIKVCQLEHDLSLFDDYDLTEIGEKGINLSGGQRQRVSIARACYSNAETIIFDDPLSALDPEVAKKLFDECIYKFLSGKTRLLMTNQLQFLQFCDTVVALGHGGVIEQGTYADLTGDDQSEVSRLLKDVGTGKSARPDLEEKEKLEDSQGEKKKVAQKDAAALITKEERTIGAVPLSAYLKYIKAGGGYLKFVFVYSGFVLSTLNALAYSAWVTLWTSDFPQYERLSEATYLGVYFVLAVTLGIVTYFRAFVLAQFGVKASETLHHNLLDSILRAPQSFFDTTPIGRILSRFSKDIYSIDIELTDNFDFFLFCSLQVIVSLATIMFATPWFGVAILPLGFFYFLFLNYFREVSRETKRLDSISRSPVYQTFSETLGGLITIRAYGQSYRFMGDFEGKVDENTRAYYNNKNADRWLSVRLEFIGSMITGLAAFFACNVVISQSATGGDANSNFASLAGLSLTQAIALTGLLNWCVRTFAQLEAAMK